MRNIIALMCFLLVPHLQAQGGGTIVQPSKNLAAPSLPTVNLVFSAPKLDSPLQLPSSVMSGGPRCGPDGKAFLQIMTPPPRYDYKVVYSIAPDGKVTHYAIERMVGLTVGGIIAFDPGVSAVAMLLSAAPVGQPRASSVGYYLTLYSYDGELLKYSKLDLGLQPSNIAQLGDKEFLIMGADMETAQPRFVVVDDSGSRLRELAADAITPSGQKLKSTLQSLNIIGGKPDDMPAAAKVYAVLSMFQTAHTLQGVLMFMPGAETQVVELRRSGETRLLRLRLPRDQIADSIITDNGRWFVRAYQRDADSQWSLYEVDPETGEARHRIDTLGVPATSIACPTDSGFYGLRWMENKPYLIFGSLR